MAIEAKVSFLNQTEHKLSKEVTADTMARVLSIIADVMQGFDFKEITVMEERDDLLDCYIEALRVQGRSEKTLYRYRYVINRMLEAIGVPVRQVTVYHLRNYISDRKAKGIKDSTMESEREVFTAFFNWLQRESLISKNPVANLGSIKCAKQKKEIFTRVDLEKLNGSCECSRDKALLYFLSSTGCRVSEIVGLDSNQIRFTNDGAECVVHGKGNKYRRVYINSVAAMFLRKYLMERTDESPALFVNRYGVRMQPGGVREMLNRLADRAGVNHVHPHKFRRTLATNMSRHGMPIQEVASILGHDRLDTTMKYVMLDDEDIRQSYKRYA